MRKISLSDFISYCRRHPGYWCRFLRDIIAVYVAKLKREPIVVVTTESEGLGGYLWIRNYYRVIKEHFSKRGCCIILLGMANWEEFVRTVDDEQLDIFRPFESCDSHKLVERLFFRLFRADYYIDFRTIYLADIVRAKHKILGNGFQKAQCFYGEANNATFQQWMALPSDFHHTIPLHEVDATWMHKPYVVLVEGGFTQGKLSDAQLQAITQHLLDKDYVVFFNGNISRLRSLLPEASHPSLIDGYQYPLHQYGTIVKGCCFVVTPNTLLYHYAIQLDKPCVVMSANEYLTVKLDKQNQLVLFDEALQEAYNNNTYKQYVPAQHYKIAQIDIARITRAIDECETMLSKE